MSEQRYTDSVQGIINDAKDNFDIEVEVEEKRSIPTDELNFPLEQTQEGRWKWLKIQNVVCVFIDMKNSTKVCADSTNEERASIYQFFTDTAVRILNEFEASYIDIKGDGAFGLFDESRMFHAVAAAITFKTFARYQLGSAGPSGTKISCHIGMHMADVLVKRLGLRKTADATGKRNEVWAGNPVNFAAKLAAIGGENELLVSKPIYKRIKSSESEYLLKTCGCPKGDKGDVWGKRPLVDEMEKYGFDFDEVRFVISDGWCEKHGADFCKEICKLDE